MDKKNASRLGKILLQKGIVTQTQLDIAIAEQVKRRQHSTASTSDATAKVLHATALGTILIELGFINELQLKRCLNWQLILRRMTIVMSICAPLMTLGANTATAASSSTASTSSKTATASSSLPGYSLPLTIQAEGYDSMSGIQTEPTSDTGGGLDVGYIHVNDWMSYNNHVIHIPVTGNYKMTYRVASPSGGGSFILHEADGSQLYDTVAVPATGGSQIWISLERTISLTAGDHAFGITALARGSGYNINWFSIGILLSTTSSSAISSPVTNSSAAANSSAATTSGTSASSSSAQSSSSQSSSSLYSTPPISGAASSVSPLTSVAGPVYLQWNPPSQRENGVYLDLTEIGGYELRYRRSPDMDFTYVTLDNAWSTRYYFPRLEGDYEFQIAAFDKSGFYSQFIPVAPR